VFSVLTILAQITRLEQVGVPVFVIAENCCKLLYSAQCCSACSAEYSLYRVWLAPCSAVHSLTMCGHDFTYFGMSF
jgi:hypothetical protein